MTQEELRKIYEQIDTTVAQLQAAINTLQEIRAKLASGGGPGPRD